MLQTFKGQLIEKRNLTADVLHLKFKSLSPFSEGAKSGQYMMLLVPQPDTYPARRQFSIASDCTDINTFNLVAKIIPGGVASEVFKNLQLNQETEFQGPAGIFNIHYNEKPKIFLATGTGIAPMKAMIHELLHKDVVGKDQPIYLLWGLQKHEDVYFLDELKKMSEHHPHFHFNICLSREENLNMIEENQRPFFKLGRITKEFEDNTNINQQALNTYDFYLCGNREVVEALRLYLLDKMVVKENIIFEKF